MFIFFVVPFIQIEKIIREVHSLGFKKMFKRKFGSIRRRNENKVKETSTKTGEHDGFGESSGIDKKRRMVSGHNEEEKIQQHPKELTEPGKCDKLLQEALEKGDERATSKACIRLQHAYSTAQK